MSEGPSAADVKLPPGSLPPPLPRVGMIRLLCAFGSHQVGLSALGRWALSAGYGHSVIRAVNYHQTLAENSRNFESHLRWYSRHFVSVSERDLISLLEGAAWPHRKPGLIVSFDDGLRSNVEIAAPLLERHGMRGWFFVPTAFIDCPPSEQRSFAEAHGIWGAAWEPTRGDGRVAASWEELRGLCARGHSVGVHTATHMRLGPGTTHSEMEREIVVAKSIAEARLSARVRSFCWVGGEESSYSREAAAAVGRAGFTLGFQTHGGLNTSRTDPLEVNRVNVEDRWPLSLASFQVSGAIDLVYSGQRRRVRELTRTSRSRRADN